MWHNKESENRIEADFQLRKGEAQPSREAITTLAQLKTAAIVGETSRRVLPLALPSGCLSPERCSSLRVAEGRSGRNLTPASIARSAQSLPCGASGVAGVPSPTQL